jgi:phospholipid/cholesterol/gamma-HCH transport system permease protein
MTTGKAKLEAAPLAGGRPGLRVVVGGDWRRSSSRPETAEVLSQVERLGQGGRVAVQGAELSAWDTILVAFLAKLQRACASREVEMHLEGIPDGARRLLALATAVPEQANRQTAERSGGFLHWVGEKVLGAVGGAWEMTTFAGELALALGRLAVGRAQMQWRDVLAAVQAAGPEALPIVGLIGALMGVILAFVGAVQLRAFGAEIYVADLVAIGIVRELGAIMTGVVMAGRTGAAYAARIVSMQVNEEVDAFDTMGISPVDFLVLPRVLGLVAMMPLLCLYADLVGVLGGMFVGVFMLDISPTMYYQQTVEALGLGHLCVGLVMSAVFGVLVAYFGCFKGLRCGRSASSVGEATTSAVVSSIVSIVVATAAITYLADLLGV